MRRVEVVTPSGDLPVAHLEDAYDRQGDRSLAADEVVDPFHHRVVKGHASFFAHDDTNTVMNFWTVSFGVATRIAPGRRRRHIPRLPED